MTVRKIWTPTHTYDATGTGFEPIGDVIDNEGNKVSFADDQTLELIGQNCWANSNTRLVEENGHWTVQGNSTEGALVALAMKMRTDKDLLRVEEAPFDSKRKMMSSLNHLNGDLIQFTKGAPDFLLTLCNSYIGNDKEPMTEEIMKNILSANDAMASKGLRVLALAYKKDIKKINEEEMTFLGLVALMLSMGSMLNLATTLDTQLLFKWDPTFASWHSISSRVSPISEAVRAKDMEAHAFIETHVLVDKLHKKNFETARK